MLVLSMGISVNIVAYAIPSNFENNETINNPNPGTGVAEPGIKILNVLYSHLIP